MLDPPYYYFIVNYPHDGLNLVELRNLYFFVQENNRKLVQSKFFYFFSNSIPLITEKKGYLIFMFPLGSYREDASQAELQKFYSLWLSRLEERLRVMPQDKFTLMYGLDARYITTIERL